MLKLEKKLRPSLIYFAFTFLFLPFKYIKIVIEISLKIKAGKQICIFLVWDYRVLEFPRHTVQIYCSVI